MLHITKEELEAKLRRSFPDSTEEMIQLKVNETWKVMQEVDAMTDEEVDAEWKQLSRDIQAST